MEGGIRGGDQGRDQGGIEPARVAGGSTRAGCAGVTPCAFRSIMPKNLPIVPMRSAVLFPGVSLPVTAARPQTLRAVEAALRDPDHRVLVVAQRADGEEVLAEGLYTIGTIATIASAERGLGGGR